MKHTKEGLENLLRSLWPCSNVSHEEDLTRDGWCGGCGMAAASYVIHVRPGDSIFQASPYIFNHGNRLIFWEQALVDLGIIKSPAARGKKHGRTARKGGQ